MSFVLNKIITDTKKSIKSALSSPGVMPDSEYIYLGWIASLLPLYMKYYYKDDPIFDGTKVIVSLYENVLDGKMDKNFVKKIKYDEIDDSNLTLLNESTYENLYKIALKYADGAILTSDIKNKFSDVLKNIDIPILECPHSTDDYKEKYSEFYNSFL